MKMIIGPERPDYCGTCRYWEEYDQDIKGKDVIERLGNCHRYPPRFVADTEWIESVTSVTPAGEDAAPTGPITGFFPETQIAEWCGEWKAATVTAEEP